MNELALKIAFATLLLKTPDNPFKAACDLFPNNTNRALRVANEWPYDAEVIAAKSTALEEAGELAFLPTKAEACRKIWGKVDTELMEPDEFTKMMKLYCDTMGFIEKAGVSVQVNNQTNNLNVDAIATIAEAEQVYKDMINVG